MGTELVISGHGLTPHGVSGAPTLTVLVGRAQCSDVFIVNTTSPVETLRCTLTAYEAGYHFVDIFNERGLASVSPSPLTPGPHRNVSGPPGPNSAYPQFLLTPVVTAVAPETGSTRGGAMVTVTGSGFSPVAARMSVLLGNHECAIVSSTYSEIVCVTGVSGEEGEMGGVIVTVNGFQADTSVTYEYLPSATPTVYSVAPATGVGGSDVEISGTNFGTDVASVSVHILSGIGEWNYGSMESPCIVSAVTDTSINCSLPIKPAGSYTIVAHISGKGLAESSTTIEYALTVTSISPTQTGNGGGVAMTINGGGFPETLTDDETGTDESALSVWVCSTECRVSNSSLSQVTCILDAPSDGDASLVCSDVRVSYNGMSATATESFEFSDDITPHVTSVSPLIGGTAGGTIVTIIGDGFLHPGATDPFPDDITVTIDGAVCEWFGHDSVPNDTFIECRTSEHRTTLLAEVKVFVRDYGFALPHTPDTHIRYQYIDRWSSPYTWGGQSPPGEGESVLIRPGQVVFLDTDTPVLNLILIEGELIFEDEQDLHLQAKYIFINTGRLQVSESIASSLHE